MAAELVTDTPGTDDREPGGPATEETTADVDPVEPAEVEEFRAAPSSPSEVVEPANPALEHDPAGAGDEQSEPDAVPGGEAVAEYEDEEPADDETDEPAVAAPVSAEAESPELPVPGEGVPGEGVPVEEPVPETKKKWYIVKVTSGREESIKASIERRVKIENLEEFFGQVYIPVEKVVEVKKVKETKNGERITKERRVTKARKKFPGYLMAEVEFNDSILYLFRETSGVGDFVGSSPGKPPSPMLDIDIQRMLDDGTSGAKDEAGGKRGPKIKVKLDFEKGDKVRIRDGAFANMEGEIKDISTPKDNETPKVTVVVTIFGRGVEVEVDYWQVDKV